MNKLEKEYLKTLDTMTPATLAQFITQYINKAVVMVENLSSLVTEIQMHQKVLVEKLGKLEKEVK